MDEVYIINRELAAWFVWGVAAGLAIATILFTILHKKDRSKQ